MPVTAARNDQNPEIDRITKLKQLDKDILAAENRLRLYSSKTVALKQSRYNLVPIYKLSVETLQDIFLLCQLGPNEYRLGKKWDWLTVTKVCHRWREIALSCPLLWTEIRYFGDVKKIHAFLDRSKRAHLSVALGKEDKRCDLPENALALIEDEIERVKDLTVSIGGQERQWWKVQTFLTTNCLSNLKSLCLRMNPRVDYNKSTQLFIHTASQPVACLESLSLKSLSIPWEHNIFNNLSELSLEEINESQQPTASELFRILKVCPNIERLKLENAGPKKPLPNTVELLSLPCLSYFRIAPLKYSLCTRLLDRLIFPEDARWSLGCHNFPIYEQTFLILNLPRKIRRSSCVEIGFIHDEVRIEICNEEHGDSFGLILTWDWRTPAIFSVEEVFVSIGPSVGQHLWQKVTQLSLEFRQFYTSRQPEIGMIQEEGWSIFLDQIPAIQRLSIIFPKKSGDVITSARCFLEGLARNIETSSSTLYDFRCPKLQDLDLSFANFSTNDGEQLIKMLRKHLERRDFRDKRLQKLGLHSCPGITEKNISDLNMVIDVVEWNK